MEGAPDCENGHRSRPVREEVGGLGRRRPVDRNKQLGQAHPASGSSAEQTPSRGGPSDDGPEPAEQEKGAPGIKYLADYCGPRPVGSEGISLAREYIRQEIARMGYPLEVQIFRIGAPLYSRARVLTQSRRSIPCLPVPGSPATSGTLRGVPRVVSLYGPPSHHGQLLPPNSLALVGIEPGYEGEGVRAAARRSASGVLLYRIGGVGLYSGKSQNGKAPIPCVTISAGDALFLGECDEVVELIVEVDDCSFLGENIMVDIGKGEATLLFLANYDTRASIPGAYRNASGVVALLGLLSRLRKRRHPHLLVGFLDADEVGLHGSRHCSEVLDATGVSDGLRAVFYVSGVGLPSLSVVPGRGRVCGRLAALACRSAAEEGIRCWVSAPDLPPWSGLTKPWRPPVIVLTGPSISAQHTPLDRPDLLHPRFVSKGIATLDRLAQLL